MNNVCRFMFDVVKPSPQSAAWGICESLAYRCTRIFFEIKALAVGTACFTNYYTS